MSAAAFEHRRQILRRCTESDTHANTFSDPNRDSYADSNSYGNCNSNGNCNAYGYTYINPEDRSHAKNSADASTSPSLGTASDLKSLVFIRDTVTSLANGRSQTAIECLEWDRGRLRRKRRSPINFEAATDIESVNLPLTQRVVDPYAPSRRVFIADEKGVRR